MPSMDEGQRDEHSTENEELGEWAGLCRRHLVKLEKNVFPFPRKMLGWMKHKLEVRLLGEISITSDMQMTPPLWQKVKKN